MIMGGVADINQINKLEFGGIIDGVFYNVLSRKDQMLKYMFKLVKANMKPCGISYVRKDVYVTQVNVDLSGHLDFHHVYFENLAFILNIA